MSGVAAVLSLSAAPRGPLELEPLLKILERRGPDGTTYLARGPVLLGCTRLDTLPEDGPQPASYGPVTVVADARIDNRPELERCLKLSSTASDAKVIAAAIARWGTGAGERLEGDFAIIAWDGRRLLALRDRFGVRPLFYAEASGRLILASEVRAITAHQAVTTLANRDYFIEQLAAQIPLTVQSPYRAIQRVMPGELLEARPENSLRKETYYTLPTAMKRLTLEEAAEETGTLLDEAVRVRLRSNLVACDLSGGMDSSSIYVTARALGKTPHALSMVSDVWPTMDERPFSREAVGDGPWTWVYAEHHVPFSKAPATALSFDEPMQDVLFDVRLALNSALPEGCRVVLSGHGGDSTMTGSTGALRTLLRQGRWLTAYREARAWADQHDLQLRLVLQRALDPGFSTRGNLPWASPSIAREAKAAERHTVKVAAKAAAGSVDIANFLLSTEPGLRQQPSCPVEIRYPFLHRPLVEHALTTPAVLKAQGQVGKRVLRAAMRKRLPGSILNRSDKTDFMTAYAYGIHKHWPLVEAWLREPRLAELGVLDANGFRRLARAFRDSQMAHFGGIVYALVNEAWLRGHAVPITTLSPVAHRRMAQRVSEALVPRREVEGR